MKRSTHADDRHCENAALSSDEPFSVSTHNKKKRQPTYSTGKASGTQHQSLCHPANDSLDFILF
jgi:hypothetical protein